MQIQSPGLYDLPLANCNRCLVVRILQDKHFGLEEGFDQPTCLGLWKNHLPTRFEAYKKISPRIMFHTRIRCTYQQPALLIQGENCL